MAIFRKILVGAFTFTALLAAGCFDDGDDVMLLQPMDAAFELLAVQESAGIQNLDLNAKAARVENVLDAIRSEVESAGRSYPCASVAYGTRPAGQVGSAEAVIPFPGIDLDFDGVPDDVGRMIELAFDADSDRTASVSSRAHRTHRIPTAPHQILLQNPHLLLGTELPSGSFGDDFLHELLLTQRL